MKVEVLFMRVHQLHFGLLLGPQPPVVEVPSPGILLLSLALRSVSRRLLGRLYAINGGSWKMRANLSFDWRKYQSAYSLFRRLMCYGDCVWLLGQYDWSSPYPWRANSLPAWARELFAYRLVPYFFCSRKRLKNWNIKLFLLSLKGLAARNTVFQMGRMRRGPVWVWVKVGGFPVHIFVDITHRILYDLSIKKVHFSNEKLISCTS